MNSPHDYCCIVSLVSMYISLYLIKQKILARSGLGLCRVDDILLLTFTDSAGTDLFIRGTAALSAPGECLYSVRCCDLSESCQIQR